MATISGSVGNYAVDNYLENQSNYTGSDSGIRFGFSATAELNIVFGSFGPYVDSEYYEVGYATGVESVFSTSISATINPTVEASVALSTAFTTAAVAGVTANGLPTGISTSLTVGTITSSVTADASSDIATSLAGVFAGNVSQNALQGIYVAFSESATAQNSIQNTVEFATSATQTTVSKVSVDSGSVNYAVAFSQSTTAGNTVGTDLALSMSLSQADIQAINTIAAEFSASGVLLATVIARGNLDGDIDFNTNFSTTFTASVTHNATPAEENAVFSVATITPSLIKSTTLDLDLVTAQGSVAINEEAGEATLSSQPFAFALFAEVYFFVEAIALLETFSSTDITGTNTIGLGGEVDEYTWDDVSSWLEWPNSIWGFTGTRNLQSTTTTDITAGYELSASADFSSEFSETATATSGKFGSASLATEFSTTILGGFAVDGVLIELGSFSTAITPEVEIQAQLDIDTAASMSSTFTRLVNGSVSVGANFSTTTTATVNQFISIEMPGLFSQISFGEDFDFALASLNSEFSTTITADVAVNSEMDISASFAQSTNTDLFKNATLNPSGAFTATIGDTTVSVAAELTITATTTQITDARNFVNGELSVTAFATQVTVGRERQPDPYRKVLVNAESRILTVYAESREVVVDCETRVEKINIPAYAAGAIRRVA